MFNGLIMKSFRELPEGVLDIWVFCPTIIYDHAILSLRDVSSAFYNGSWDQPLGDSPNGNSNSCCAVRSS